MPIYEYHCDKCGNTFERMESISDNETEKPCPECKFTAHRIISHSSFQLKGSGWYTSDYKNKSGKKEIPACPAAKNDAPACSGCAHAAGDK